MTPFVLALFFSGSYPARMSRSSEIRPGPVTYGRLRADGQLVEVGCQCGRVTPLDPKALLFGDEVPVPGSHVRYRCRACGQVGAWCRPDSRVEGVDGRYPNFQGKN